MLGSSSFASSPLSAEEIEVPPFTPTAAKVGPDSQIFASDQQTTARAYVWATPFTALDSGVASGGLVLDVRQALPENRLDPLNTGVEGWRNYVAGLRVATAASLASVFADNTRSHATVTNGRTANLQESWSGGAPAWYGVTQRGRVALHYRLVMRPVEGRSWFSTATTTALALAFGGSGYVRVTKTVAGTTTDVTIGGTVGHTLTETDFLTDGLVLTDVMALSAGDIVDVYYVQAGESWGGLVAKAVPAADLSEAAVRAAPVVGCGLFDDGTPPAVTELTSWRQIEITHDLAASASATIQLPLLNPLKHDGFGYEWRRTSDQDDPGVLVRWWGGEERFTLRRGSLVQLHGGLVGESYVLYTGVIDDFVGSGDGEVVLRCVGFERRALRTMMKNEPDEISYMTFGYRKQRGTTEPIYGIAAYDNWAIEDAIQDTLVRVGIDASRFAAKRTATTVIGTSTDISYDGELFKKFRARSVTGQRLRCERPARYGNVGQAFDDQRPVDDPYLFAPDAAKEPWNRVRELADRYGYDVRFDHQGDCLLQARGNASTVVDVDATVAQSSGSTQPHPSAFGGTYREWSETQAAVAEFTFTGSRVDVSVPRGPGLGAWYSMRVVRQSDNFEVANIQNLSATALGDVWFYDYAMTTDGKNATVVTLFSGDHDTYRVECRGTVTGAADGAVRRLDCFFVYAIDPLRPLYPKPLSTAENAFGVRPSDAGDEMRNLVYVIGRRKAAVQDSTKFRTNPNNPDPEYIVEVAVDPASIADPAAKNFIGGRSEAAIVDSSIADNDYAAYLARTFVYRYRTPNPPAEIEHTGIPVMELRDPLYAVEATYQSVNALYVLWAVRYTHRFEANGRFTTFVQTSAWPEFASYEPREDIDIDAEFGGSPVAHVEVAYTSLTGHRQVNLPATGVVHPSDQDDIVEVTASVQTDPTFGPYLDMSGHPWPPVPGTVFLRAGTASTQSVTVELPSSLIGAVAGSELLLLSPGGTLRVHGAGPIVSRIPTGVRLERARSITSVQVTLWRPAALTTAVMKRDRVVAATASSDSEFTYIWSVEEQYVTVRWNRRPGDTTIGLWVSVEVTYQQDQSSTSDLLGDGWVTDSPYLHLTNIDYRDESRRIYLPWKQGDGTALYQRGSVTSYNVRYRRLGPVDGTGAFADPYAGESPFADPTTSELGHVCTLTLDALVTGFYRISIRSLIDNQVVAYLTEPTAEPDDAEAHWAYVTSGPRRTWVWDYHDAVGAWNQQQSAPYAAMAQGQFELAEREAIGAGWYVWNRELADGAPGPLALIAGDRAGNGRPVFGQGTYGQWYVMIEVRNDRLEELHDTMGAPFPRTVKTRPVEGADIAPLYTTATDAAVIYTHLPEPAQLELEVADWVGAEPYDPTNLAHRTEDANWGDPNASALVNPDAVLHNAQPVRLRLTAKPRPGLLWSGNHGEQELQVTRHAHLRAAIFDQFAVNQATNYPKTSVEQRTVYTRQMLDDTHTITFVDTGWRKAKTLKSATFPTGTVEWVFRPDDFRKQFRTTPNEPIRFGDYLQLTDVPEWEQHRQVAAPRSRYILGFMAYLFYLSVSVQDRSGRRAWGMNRRFLDKSKLVTNAYSDWFDPAQDAPTPATATTYRADWPVDAQRLQRRTIVCRQWTSEPGWQTAQVATWNLAGTVGERLLRHKWSDHEPTATTLAGSAWPSLEFDHHSIGHGERNELPAAWDNFTRQLGAWTGTTATTRLGRWTWEPDPRWIPCVSRDWHPYFCVPPMVEPVDDSALTYYHLVDARAYDSGKNEGRDAAASATWGSWTRDMTGPSAQKRFTPGERIDTERAPNKPPLDASAHDYVRQDELVHYEDLRGLFTRRARPSEQPVKLTPVSPYYFNPNRYAYFRLRPGVPTNALDDQVGGTPVFQASMTAAFRLGFRAEYIVESSTYFPTGRFGAPLPLGFLPERTRFAPAAVVRSVTYDTGAWVGWKDDIAGGTTLQTRVWWSPAPNISNVFTWGALPGALPVAVGPELPVTKELYMHMVLVNERRGTPL